MVEELLRLKDMLDKGMITKEEFDAAKNELGFKPASVSPQRRPTTKSGFAPSSHKPAQQTKTVEKVQCPKCGEDMPASRSYCVICGARLEGAKTKNCRDTVDRQWHKWSLVPIAIIIIICIAGLLANRPDPINIQPTELPVQITSTPRPAATKYVKPQTTPPKWLLESIGNTVQSSMKDQDVTFWTSNSGVYITIGMPVNKSDFEVWASTFGRVQFDDFCTTMDELNTSAWDVIVHQGYEDSAIVSIEVVGTPSGDLILSYLNGKQTYNFLED